MAAEARNRPKQQHLDALPLRDFARDIPCHPLVRKSSDVAKRLPDTFLGDDVQEWALSEFHRHGLPERPVEHVVASCIDEVRDEDAVLVRKGRSAPGCAGAREIQRGRSSDGRDDGECEEDPVRSPPARG